MAMASVKFPGLLAAVVFALVILPSPAQLFECEAELPSGRNAIRPENFIWPDGKVFFEISNDFTPEEVKIVKRGMSMITSVTCIQFEVRSDQKDWVFVKRDEPGCWSAIGRDGGNQSLNLGKNCVYDYIVAHEFMHALGFHHEHVRSDRNEYVRVNFPNIQSGKEHNFQIYEGRVFTPYDYSSVMHYGAYGFAKDPKYPTLIPVDPDAKLGGKKLTKHDATKTNRLYECPF